ncbi:efflux RND transporter permease subunit [Granulicella tundricola]|uniref:Acriflavin resistance protein n=1 Tax=Granulicella tundricola (strain ATCC BAA-1859 / DSM 23138 / MP5ACTX9) TaxID=1198114 RepID=E8WYJ3_GRATM|nr:efflux RND transporter permease subunit [Granulicella tundricola]ADW67591.1 acriflavin resistance protein [Granulicella tundricola MP5ACTX9]
MSDVIHASISERPSGFWLARLSKPIYFFLAVLTIAGIYAAFQVPISVFPDTNFPRVVIGVDNGVMPVEQMQVTITKPIEDAVNSVPGLTTVRSTTSRGSAEISLLFDWNVDMFRTLQLTDSALAKIQSSLPATAKITTNRLTFATFPILGYALTADDRGADTVSQTALWGIATYNLKPQLNRVSGVATVVVQGGKVPEFHIVPDPAKLQTAGVTLLDLVNAVQTSNIIDSPGLYEADHQLILGLVGAQAHDVDQLGNLVVKNTAANVPVRINDVAMLGPATMPVFTSVDANGKPAVLLNITRQPTSNTVAVATAVDAKVQALKSMLPPGVHMTPFYDQSELVRESIASVRDAILIGLVLACLILFLFLRDWTSSLIAGLVIPVTVAITILFLWIIGQSFNLMTLGGLAAAIGLVIDDAIVVVENIVVHRDAGQTRSDAVRLALREIIVPLVGSTVTPVVVFLPLIATTGVTGSFFRALAVTMTASLLTSLMLALTFTPALSLSLLREAGSNKKHGHEENGPVMRRLLATHNRLLSWTIGRTWAIGAIALVLIGSSYFAFNALGTNLLPEMDEGAFILDYIMPAGSSLQATQEVLDHVEHILHETPEVEITTRRTGLQLGLAAVTEANTGDISVRLKAKRSRPIDEIMNEVRDKIKEQYPQLDVEFVQVLEDMINDLSNSPEPIQIKLFSNDTTLLHELGPKVQAAIAAIPGIVDTQNGVDNTLSGPATTFQVDPSVAARLGFTPQEVAEDATSLMDGLPTTDPVIVGGRPYTVRVRMSDEHRASLSAIENTVFNSATGHTATLGALAQVTELPPQNEIRRENLEQVVLVSGRLEGSNLGGAMTQVKAAVAKLSLPASVRVEYGGTYQEQQKSFHDLAQVLVLALALVFGVLLAEFRNFSAPIAILTSSVLSMAGVVFALLTTNTNFNVASFMGLIMVIGIVAKNGILLLDADERARAEGANALDAMLHAAQRRLRPIVMTAVAAMCGMLPLAFAFGAGSQMLQPLAIAVIGGLIISVLLSLVVTPAIYYQLTMRTDCKATAEPQETLALQLIASRCKCGE